MIEEYKVRCPHCNYADVIYHLNWDYLSMICLECKKEFGKKEVLKQLDKYINKEYQRLEG